jgi:hypothetical protein
LLNGKAKTITELAAEEYYDARYLIDLLHLAYLAPDIQKAIASGKIHADLTLDKLKKRLFANRDRWWRISGNLAGNRVIGAGT